jgi:hypothetical protein
MINKLCDLALVYAVTAEKPCVDADIVQELVRDGLILKPATDPLFLSNRMDHLRKAAE